MCRKATSSVLSVYLVLTTLFSLSDTRQIRISRFNVQVDEDTTARGETATLLNDEQPEINATVRELTPYPAAGYRPGRAFKLPNEEEEFITTTTTTTDIPLAEFTTVTTTDYEFDTTTMGTTETSRRDVENSFEISNDARFTGYPASGYRPRVAFNLPNEINSVRANEQIETQTYNDCNKSQQAEAKEENLTPYPAAGYRPCAPFRLPNEESTENNVVGQSKQTTNNKNPACGVSTNPLAPKPPVGSVDEPDSERVPVATNTGNGNGNENENGNGNVNGPIVPAALRGPQPIIWQQPLTVLPQQPFVYTAHLQTW